MFAVFAMRCGLARALPGLAVLVALVVLPLKPARADEAETFIQTYLQHGFSILNDKTLSRSEQHAKFVALLGPITDMRRVALYALGSTAKTAPTDQVEAFVTAFQDLEVSLYERELARWHALKVEGSVAFGPGDTIVQTFQLDENGRRWVNADEIDFRVEKEADKFVILDFCVRGAWIAVNQHTQYREFLEQRGNTLIKLTRKLINRDSKMNRW